MPNVKVYMDETLLAANGVAGAPLLEAIRAHLCHSLGVENAACHVVLLLVRSLAGQAPVNVELALLRRQDRTRARIQDLCDGLRGVVAALTGVPVAVRCTMMEAEHYIVTR